MSTLLNCCQDTKADLHLLNLSEVCVFAVGEHCASLVELSFDLHALVVQDRELRL